MKNQGIHSQPGLRAGRRHSAAGLRGQSGFTLVEMLTVVIVVAILSSLLAEVVVLAKRRGQSSVCVSNLHEMGIGLRSFVADHNAYPFFITWDESRRAQGFGTTWQSSILPDQIGDLKKGKGVFRCPAQTRPKDWPTQAGYGFYGYNADGLTGTDLVGNLGLGGMGAGGELKPVPESDVVHPSEMLAIGDGVVGWKRAVQDGVGKIGRVADAGKLTGIPNSGAAERVRRRHNGRLNELFCDQHAESLPLGTLYERTDSASLALWNRDAKPHAERLK